MNDTIEKLKIQIESNANSAFKSLDKLSASLSNLGGSLGGVNTTQLAKINNYIRGMANATKDLKLSGLNNLSKNLTSLNNVDTSKLRSSLESIGAVTREFSKSNYGAKEMKDFSSGLKGISTASKNLEKLDYKKVAENIKKLTEAIKPLTDEMLRGGGAVNSYGSQMRELVKASKMAENVRGSTKKGFYGEGKTAFQLFNLQSVIGITRRVGNAIGGAVTNINSYVENINLFTVAMGEFADAGRKAAEQMEFKLGIDSGEAMRQMGFFQQLQTSFGTTADKAFIVSKNLTQLGYDMASFLNIDTGDAFLKLQSGLAGKIFCLVHKGLCTVTYLNRETPKRTILC